MKTLNLHVETLLKMESHVQEQYDHQDKTTIHILTNDTNHTIYYKLTI